jgi:glutathione S-transferase
MGSALSRLEQRPITLHVAMNELLGLPFSPWSEKAKWALEVRSVRHRFRVYQPLIGEPGLRIKTGRWRGRVTVPVLFDERGTVYDDSTKIARFADAHGEGPTLFPQGSEAAIEHWIEVGELALDAGRALSLERTLKDRQALAELLPRGLRQRLGGFGPNVAALGVRRTLRKYAARARNLDTHRETVRAALDELRDALEKSSSTTRPRTLLGAFTFADIVAAQMLSFVTPPNFGLKLGTANRRSFTDPQFARDYADLIAWRDALYDAYRPRSDPRDRRPSANELPSGTLPCGPPRS